MSTTPSTFPTLNPTPPQTTQPQTTMYTTQPQTTMYTTQPQTTMYTTQPQTTMYTTQPQTTLPYGGTTVYTQPSIIPNPTQYPPYYPPYGGYGGGYTQQPFQITAPYGTAPIIMTPGTSLPPVTMSGNDIKFIDGKKCRRVVKLKSI
jgi:hypothetical protein